MTRFFLLFACLLVFSGISAQSSQPDITFEHITIPGTIQSTQINDIEIDRNGLIWIAADGLFMYDGYKFTHHEEISPTQTLTGQEIICLLPDKNANKLYLGTHTYGIVEYTYATNAFRIIPEKDGTPIIGMLAQTEDGVVWAGSFSTGLFRIENDTLKKIPDPGKQFTLPASLLSLGNKLLIDRLTKIYVLKNSVLTDSIQLKYNDVKFSVSTRISALTSDRNGRLWLGMERGGILVYDTLKRDFIKYIAPDKAPFYNRINKIFEAANGEIWILTKANGLAIYNPVTDTFIHLTKDPLSVTSLSGNNCTSIIQDKTGILWVGSTGSLNKHDPSKIKFQHIYNNPYKKISLNDNMVRGLYEDKSEKLWIGTDSGTIHIIDRKNSSIEKIQVKIPGVTQHIVPVHFLELNEATMLIGSSIGLLQLDRKTKKISFYKPYEIKIDNRQVRQILMDKDFLYFIHSGAVFIYNRNTHHTELLSKFEGEIINATAIYLDSKGTLWVGAKSGLLRHDPVNNTSKYFEFEKKPIRPVGTYFMVLSIFEHQQKLWVGTFNSGLWTLSLQNAETPEIKNILMPEKTVYATLPDQDGNLWMSTNRGIFKYDIKNNLFLNFGLSDGIQHEEFNRLAAVKCRSGEIVFGGINGLNIFNPENIFVPEEKYQPSLLGVSVYNAESNQYRYEGLLEKTEVKLASNQTNLEFQFFIPNFRSPRRFEVYYQLSGFDPAWVKSENNTLRYVNLRPGAYELKLKTVSTNGIENEIHFPVHIQFPVWQTWWFISLAISVGVIIIYAVIKLNVKKAKEDKIQLEKLLRLRTQEIEKSREELASLNQKKDVIFSILSHDLRSPLTTLKGFLSILIDDSELLSKDDIKKHATNIRNSVTSSLDLIDNTLFWSLSQTGNITYTPIDFQLKSVFQKVNNLYSLTAEKKHINFIIDCDETIMLFADENMVYVTLRNLVSNALKFTPEGKSILISVNKNHQFAEIIIKDEGIGMSAAYIEKLLTEEHLQVKMGTSNEKGTGLGIVLCKKFIQANNGTLAVQSTEGKGSEFLVRLPLGKVN